MLDLIFPRSRSRMLTFLMLHADGRWHLRDIARRTGLPPISVARELARFEKLGLVSWEREGRQKYFSVNIGHPLFPELRGLVIKTSGLAEPLREALSGLKEIQAAAVFGSLASGTSSASSDVDLLVIGSADEVKLHGALLPVEEALGRPVNYVLMTAGELSRRRKNREPFLDRVLNGPLLPVLGDLNAL